MFAQEISPWRGGQGGANLLLWIGDGVVAFKEEDVVVVADRGWWCQKERLQAFEVDSDCGRRRHLVRYGSG